MLTLKDYWYMIKLKEPNNINPYQNNKYKSHKAKKTDRINNTPSINNLPKLKTTTEIKHNLTKNV